MMTIKTKFIVHQSGNIEGGTCKAVGGRGPELSSGVRRKQNRKTPGRKTILSRRRRWEDRNELG